MCTCLDGHRPSWHHSSWPISTRQSAVTVSRRCTSGVYKRCGDWAQKYKSSLSLRPQQQLHVLVLLHCTGLEWYGPKITRREKRTKALLQYKNSFWTGATDLWVDQDLATESQKADRKVQSELMLQHSLLSFGLCPSNHLNELCYRKRENNRVQIV